MNYHKILYVWDKSLIDQCDRLPAVQDRASLVHDLIQSYNLFEKLKIIISKPATYEELKDFHSKFYLDHLKTLEEISSDYITTEKDEEFGIGYDCTPVSEMFKLVSVIAGGSITAAKGLILGFGNIAINWCGGWHHANRCGAEGFCYVNDIVLAIEILRQKFSKILYIDLDVHHGNGVQDAYSLSDSVFTLSLHKCEPGFYPGTGLIDDIGSAQGRGYSCNVPLHAGYSDQTMEYIFTKVWSSVYSYFKPEAIVVQCGADALAYDPHGGANLTTRSYCSCIQMVLDKQKPTLLLGGGGYNHSNAARLWTSITALVVGVKLGVDIPEHDHWTKYGPSYELQVEPTLARDMNTKEYLDQCLTKIEENLQSTFTKGMKKEIFDNTLKSCSKRLNTIYNNASSSKSTTSKELNTYLNCKDLNSIYDFVE